jgi:YbbR domain-containing protein
VQRRVATGRRWSEALELARDAWRRSWNAVRNSPGLLVLSFLLAVSLWVFVTDTENPVRVDVLNSPVPLEAVNVGEGLALANQLPAIDIRAAAPEDRWGRLSSANFRAFVDVKGLEAREQEVRVQVDVEGISGVRVVEVNPRTVTVNLEELVSQEVPVSTRIVGSLPIGYELEEAQPGRESVRVIGPRSLVDLVKEAVADVNVTGLTVGVDQTVPLVARGSGGAQIRGVQIEPPNARVDLAIRQRTLVRTLPLRVEVSGDPAPGYRVSGVSSSPTTVTVQGPIEALQQLDNIRLPAVDIAGQRSDVVRVVEIPPPPGVEVGQASVTITVSITAVPGTLIMTVAPTAGDLAPGLVVRFDTETVAVLLEGPMPLLNSLLPRDIRATVDLRGLSAGSYNRPVSVEVPEGVTVASVQPETVSVTLNPE